jgi:putative flippase GtrA
MQLPHAAHRLDGPVVRQFVKYGIVGASNTILTFVIYTVGVKLGVHYLFALLIGYLVGSLNSYVLNRRWTFRAGHLAHASVGTRFGFVQVCAILANTGLLYLFVHDLRVEKILAQAILTVPVLAVTFFVNRVWSFADGTKASPPPPAPNGQ